MSVITNFPSTSRARPVYRPNSHYGNDECIGKIAKCHFTNTCLSMLTLMLTLNLKPNPNLYTNPKPYPNPT